MAFCIPNYGWAPGVSGPPDWTSTPAAGGNPSLRDPRWVSAVRLSANNSTGEEFFIRVVRDSTKVILSAWLQYNSSTTFNVLDRLWIGFNPPAPGTPRVLALNYNGTSEVEASPALTAEYFNWTGTAWVNPGGSPTWASDTRVWQDAVEGSATWAFQTKIDIAAAGLSATFGMCFQARVSSEGMVPIYRYPSGMPYISGTLSGSGLAPGTASHWQAFVFAGRGVTCDPGVWIDPSQIPGTSPVLFRMGTTNTPRHKINLNANNTFQVRPRNDSTTPANIRARIRLANWGSTPEQGWRDLLVTPPATVSANSNGLLQGNWQPNSAIQVPLPTTPPTTQDEVTFYTNRPHQCMMAVLEANSGSVYFSRDSAVQNMDFGAASKFSRKAEISVRGLDDGYPLTRRNVYVSVERVNVPPKIDEATRRKYQQVQEVYRAVTDISEGFSPEQRYVAIIGGDLRHLRFIAFDSFIQWALANFQEQQLVVNERLFQLLSRFVGNVSSMDELIERYADSARRFHEQLRYDEKGQPILPPIVQIITDILLDNISYRGSITLPALNIPLAAELEEYMPTIRYHVFRDTGLRTTVNGVVLPIVEPQAAFGYYVWLDHDVSQWELRLQGAEKLAENLYLIRPLTNGASDVTTVIHAVESGEESQIDPPERIIAPPIYKLDIGEEEPGGCLEMILKMILKLLGRKGK